MGGGRGSRVQAVHARGPGYASHCFDTPMVLSQSPPRTQGLLLMAALRTGFQLIITANLPRGERSRKHRLELKVKPVERLFFSFTAHF